MRLADAFVCPFPGAVVGALFTGEIGLVVEEFFEDVPKLVKAEGPLYRGMKDVDAGEF